jgi:hypothetical protein
VPTNAGLHKYWTTWTKLAKLAKLAKPAEPDKPGLNILAILISLKCQFAFNALSSLGQATHRAFNV